MTLCSTCKPWASTNRPQLSNRINNMVHDQDVTVHPCPECGSTEWAITDEMIREDHGSTQLGKSWGHGQITAGLATLSAVIIILLVVIGWWR